MNLTRSLDVQSHAVSRISDAIGAGEIYRSRMLTICARYHAICADLPKDTPRHVKSYLDGFFHGLLRSLETQIEFGKWRADGTYYTVTRESERYPEKLGMTWKEFGEIDHEPGAVVGSFWKSDPRRVYHVHDETADDPRKCEHGKFGFQVCHECNRCDCAAR